MKEDVERTCFDISSELFAEDIDRELLRRAQAKTPTERILWLEEMQAFADEARKARIDADHHVRFSIIGGVALIARGVQRATEDLR